MTKLAVVFSILFPDPSLAYAGYPIDLTFIPLTIPFPFFVYFVGYSCLLPPRLSLGEFSVRLLPTPSFSALFALSAVGFPLPIRVHLC
jgi:hypothetical protein